MATVGVLLLLVSSLCSITHASIHVPALYIFGDSVVDGGNTPLKPPYGVDLNASIPIRCTNGKTIADFIASFLGLPLVPPSNGSGVGISMTGLNYGHTDCGLLRETNPNNCSFQDQVNQFNLTLADNLTKIFSQKQELVQHLTSSVFLISFGINDYYMNYLSSGGVLSKMTPENFAKLLLDILSSGLKTLYRLGARKFIVTNVWPLGCIPANVNQSDILAVSCNETVNQMVRPYNDGLATTLNDLHSYLTGAVFSHSDSFQFVADLMENPRKNGLTNTTGKCFNEFTPNTPICKDRDQYLYFDNIHPTQAVNYIFALNCFDGALCTPRNIKSLVGA